MADPETEEAGDPHTYAIIGAATEVHRVLGLGFLESVYTQSLAIEFALRSISFAREVTIPVAYKEHVLAAGFRGDFLCFGPVIVEIKALARLSSLEEAQTINYLKASRHEVGLLLNFGATRLEFRRFIATQLASRDVNAKQ